MQGTSPTPQQVRAARIASGMTQKRCAELVGVALVTWQSWENPHRYKKIQPAAWRLFLLQSELAAAKKTETEPR